MLGIIPARAGSKGLKDKNLAPLAGRPLLAYTCEQALRSQVLTRVILSTDGAAIAECGKRCGVEVPFLRPALLAADDTPMVDVILHACETLERQERYEPQLVVLLQPTSPLRRAEHIDAAVRLLRERGAETVVSVVEVPHRFSPYAAMRCEDGMLQDVWTDPLPFDRFRRQDMPTLYARNGPAVLVTHTRVILARRSLYGDRVVPYVMEERDSVDIDAADDLRLAEWLLSKTTDPK